MQVPLSDLHLLTWQWHDAELRSIKIEYLAHGDLSLCLRTEISKYEDQHQLQELGIHSQLVEVQFNQVQFVRVTGKAACDAQEIILDWDFVESNPHHHMIVCSCGSTIELQFEDVELQEFA